MRSFHFPGRSTLHATEGMAATSHPLASLAAVAVLQRGGNAIDAAVTASAVLAVVEPQMTGIGGDCFALYSPGGDGEVVGLNGSGRAPAAATADWYRDRGYDAIPTDCDPHCVTIPGAIDAWERLLKAHGTIGLGEALGPAIGYAEKGYVVAPRIAHDWAESVEKLAGDPGSAEVYLRDGRAPAAGEVMRNPRLAETLKAIADGGRDAFYEGPIAEDLVGHLQSLGGLHSLADFASHEATDVTPIATDYRGYEVMQIPPNGQGLAVLLMLNLMARHDLASLDPLGVERFQLEAEVSELAYDMRDRLIGDPAFAEVPVEEVLSAAYAAELSGSGLAGGGDAAVMAQGAPHVDTIYLTVVDKARNCVSFINSLFSGFGSGLMGPKSGLLLQNRGAGFVLQEGHANCIAPNKRPLHTIIPGMVRRDGRTVMSYGVMGGHFQPVGHMHFLTNVIDYGMDPQEALDFPRGFSKDGVYALEDSVPEALCQALEARGHQVVRGGPHGGGQAIAIDWEKGTLTGGSDPRKDGCALGY